MGHAHPHIEMRVDSSFDGTLDISARVIQQHLVVSDVYADRWQTR